MQKTLVNTVIYTLLAKWERLGQVVNRLDEDALNRQMAYDPQRPIRQSLTQEIDCQKKEIAAVCEHLFKRIEQKITVSSDEVLTFMDQTVGASLASLAALSLRVQQVHHNRIVSEAGMFRRDVINNSLDKRFTLTGMVYGPFRLNQSPEQMSHSGAPNAGLPLVEQLDLDQGDTPLGWSSLVQQFARKWVMEKTGSASLTPEQLAVVVNGVQLRLLGPAYYFEQITNALLLNDADLIATVEPFLFHGIQRFNISDKSLVMLHEACERYRQLTKDIAHTDVLDDETTAQIYRLIEQGLSDSVAFRSKNFQRSIQLQSRLVQGSLLSAATIYPKADIAERLAAEQNTEGQTNIYEHLRYIAEAPNTPREIVNAGWVYVFNNSGRILSESFNAANNDGLTIFSEHISRIDTLLLKSIETAEVHRMLQQPAVV